MINPRELVILGPGEVVLAPAEVPVPVPGQALVRTRRTLVSPGTELSFYGGTHIGLPDPRNTWAKYPFRPGYAAVGEVTAAAGGGGDASPPGPAVGDRVFFFGRHADWNVLDPAAVWLPVPPDLGDDAVLLARLVQISATAATVLRRPPRRAVVVGAGLIGLFAAQVLQARGCPLVVVQDVVPARLELARRNGVARAVLARGDGLGAALDALGGEPPDAVVEATGIAGLIAPCLAAVAPGGDVVLLGIPRDACTLNCYTLLVRKNAALLGAHEGVLPDRVPPGDGRSSRQALVAEAVDGMRRGAIRTEGLVAEVVRAADAAALYPRMVADKARGLTAAIDWT